MRISVLEGDCGRVIDPGIERYEIFLNDEKVKYCFTADEEKGLVICGKIDSNGCMFLENGEVAKQELHGTVTIRQLR